MNTKTAFGTGFEGPSLRWLARRKQLVGAARRKWPPTWANSGACQVPADV